MNTSKKRLLFALTFGAALAACEGGGGQPSLPRDQEPVCESVLTHGEGALSGETLAWASRITVLERETVGRPHGSPLLHDVNGDGCLDIVFGTTGEDFRTFVLEGQNVALPMGLAIAVDGVSGDLLWEVPAQDELFALPVAFRGPGSRPHLAFAGRIGSLLAIDAQSGVPTWTFDITHGQVEGFYLNFFNPIVLGDVDGGGADDLFIVYGGYDLAGPGEPRPASYLGVIRGEDGTWLAKRKTPDLAESYMSPVLLHQEGTDAREWEVAVGTGGETLAGNMWRVRLGELWEEDSGEVYGRLLQEGNDEKGFLAPPIVGKLRPGGGDDLVSVSFGGEVTLSDLEDGVVLWSQRFPGEEIMSVPAPLQLPSGEFALAVASQVGVYPAYESVVLRVLHANDGSVVERIVIDARFAASPLTASLSSAACDDILLSATDFEATKVVWWRCEEASWELYELPMGTLATPRIFPRKRGGADLLWVAAHTQGTATVEGGAMLEVFSLSLSDGARAPARWPGYMGRGTGWMLD